MKTTFSGRWLSRGALVLGLLAGMLGTASAPSLASTRDAVTSGCPINALCLYSGANFTGDLFTVTSLVSPGTCVSLVDHGWGARAHLAINTHSNSAAMFMNDDCLGDPYQVAGNSAIPDFGGFSPNSVWVPR